jgi:hypothetical protein
LIDLQKAGREYLKLHATAHGDGARIYDLLDSLPGQIQDLSHACDGRPVMTSTEELWAQAMESLLMVGALKGFPLEQALADSLHTLRAAARNVGRARREAGRG